MNSQKGAATALRRLASFSLISRGWWLRHKYAQGGAMFAMGLCTLASVLGWYNWATGVPSVKVGGVAIATLVALGLLVAVPEKWDLLTGAAALFFFLSIVGTVFHRAPLLYCLKVIAVTGALYFGLFFLGRHFKADNGSRDGGSE